MNNDSMVQELDFEDGDDPEEFYCPICLECFDEAKEFLDHINSPLHNSSIESKKLLVQKPYCSICLVKVMGDFATHCNKDDDHLQYHNSLCRSGSHFNPPQLVKSLATPANNSTKTQPKSLPNRARTVGKKKNVSSKMIGLKNIQRQGKGWFCNVCLEEFKLVENHCNKALHAIQCIKLKDAPLAYRIKVAASKDDKKTKRSASILLTNKIEEIYMEEKDTPEYRRTLLEVEAYEKGESQTVKVSRPTVKVSRPTVEVSQPTSSQDRDSSPCPEDDSTVSLIESVTSETISMAAIDTAKDKEDHEEAVVSLFEEEDRSFIPEVEDSRNIITKKRTVRLSSENVPQLPSNSSNMIVGQQHLKQKNGNYYCSLCDVSFRESLGSTKKHMTSSLHRRKMINKHSSHPVPTYLEKLRTENSNLYNKLILIETMKLEQEERTAECKTDQQIRAGILHAKNVQALPEPLIVKDKMADRDKLDLVQLATTWDKKMNKSVYASPSKEALNSGVNKSALSNIQPQIENILVGINAISHVKNSEFHCSLCNIKFEPKTKRSEKHHVNGRLHKHKALVAAYGKEVESYLQYRSKKGGYAAMNKIINQACVPLEKLEYETETKDQREIRAKLLGVKAGQIPLPMVIMFSDTEQFDIKKALEEWNSGKKSGSKSEMDTKPVKTPTSEPSKAKVVTEPSKLKKALEPAKKDPVPVPKVDSQSFNAVEKLPPKKTYDKVILNAAKSSANTGKSPANTGKSPAVRNIFDLCKPLADVSPEKHTFKSAGATVKNIDIDTLRKSLVDADLGEFIPVVPADPKDRKLSNEDPDSRKRFKKDHNNSENVQVVPDRSQDNQPDSCVRDKNKSTSQPEPPSRTNNNNNRDGSFNRNIRGRDRGRNNDRSEERTSAREVSAPSDNKRGSLGRDVGRSRDGEQNRSFSNERREGSRDQNSYRGGSGVSRGNQQNRGTYQQRIGEQQNRGGQQDRGNQQRIGDQQNRGGQQQRDGFKTERNTRDSFSGNNQSNRTNNSSENSFMNRPSDGRNTSSSLSNADNRQNRSSWGRGRGIESFKRDVNAQQSGNNFPSSSNQQSWQGNNTGGQNQGQYSGNSNNYNQPMQSNNSYNNPQRSPQNQGPQPTNTSQNRLNAFDIDMSQMRNSGLSSMLAKVVNIAPVNQASIAKFNEATQNNAANSFNNPQQYSSSFNNNNNQQQQYSNNQQYSNFNSGNSGNNQQQQGSGFQSQYNDSAGFQNNYSSTQMSQPGPQSTQSSWNAPRNSQNNQPSNNYQQNQSNDFNRGGTRNFQRGGKTMNNNKFRNQAGDNRGNFRPYDNKRSRN